MSKTEMRRGRRPTYSRKQHQKSAILATYLHWQACHSAQQWWAVKFGSTTCGSSGVVCINTTAVTFTVSSRSQTQQQLHTFSATLSRARHWPQACSGGTAPTCCTPALQPLLPPYHFRPSYTPLQVWWWWGCEGPFSAGQAGPGGEVSPL